jgi:hypothetical protein
MTHADDAKGHTVKLCKCTRKANQTYGGHHWCCIQCARNGLHTVWCNRRAAAKAG